MDTHSPTGPYLAEYGADFQASLAAHPPVRDLPYLADFAALEWRVGEAIVEVAHVPVTLEMLASLTSDALADTPLVLQPGVRYLSVSWNVDELMMMYLSSRVLRSSWPSSPW